MPSQISVACWKKIFFLNGVYAFPMGYANIYFLFLRQCFLENIIKKVFILYREILHFF
jgi:hypothetical protein